MADEQSTKERGENQQADPRIHLAVERTSLAMERTQLAWIRTVIGFITAGIAIDRGTAALQQARVAAGIAWSKNGHFAGMLLTITGTILMIMVTVYFIKRTRELDHMRGIHRRLPGPAVIISFFVILIGVLAIYALRMSL